MISSEQVPSGEIPKITEEVVALFKEDRLYEAKKLAEEYYDQEREEASKGEPRDVDAKRLKVEFIFLKTRHKINWYESVDEFIKEYEEIEGWANCLKLYEICDEIEDILVELRNKNRTV